MSEQEWVEQVLAEEIGSSGLHELLTEAARRTVSEVPGATLADYRAARKAGFDDVAYLKYADAAGEAVRAVLEEDLEGEVPEGGMWRSVLTTLLNLDSQGMRARLGDRYLPDVGQVTSDDFPDDDTDDDTDVPACRVCGVRENHIPDSNLCRELRGQS